MKAIQIRNFNSFSLSCLVTFVLNMMFMEIDYYFRLGHTCFTIDNHLRTTWKQVKFSHKLVRYSQNKVMGTFPNKLNRKPLLVYNTTCVNLLIHLWRIVSLHNSCLKVLVFWICGSNASLYLCSRYRALVLWELPCNWSTAPRLLFSRLCL